MSTHCTLTYFICVHHVKGCQTNICFFPDWIIWNKPVLCIMTSLSSIHLPAIHLHNVIYTLILMLSFLLLFPARLIAALVICSSKAPYSLLRSPERKLGSVCDFVLCDGRPFQFTSWTRGPGLDLSCYLYSSYSASEVWCQSFSCGLFRLPSLPVASLK